MNLIEVNDIVMNYHSIKGETQAIKDISFNIKKNDFISILGPSGCGKSTLLNIIADIIKPSHGSVKYKGEDIRNHTDKIGYMFQKDNLFEWLSVYDNVLLGLKIKRIINNENIRRVEDLLVSYELDKFKDHYPSELSGGMRQRVALIRTLALNPDILFLDEPFSALDYQTRLKVCDEVYSIIKNEGKTAVMVTHDIGEAISLSNKIILLTKRPALIDLELKVKFKDDNLTPFKRREEEEYGSYFNILWKELSKYGE